MTIAQMREWLQSYLGMWPNIVNATDAAITEWYGGHVKAGHVNPVKVTAPTKTPPVIDTKKPTPPAAAITTQQMKDWLIANRGMGSQNFLGVDDAGIKALYEAGLAAAAVVYKVGDWVHLQGTPAGAASRITAIKQQDGRTFYQIENNPNSYLASFLTSTTAPAQPVASDPARTRSSPPRPAVGDRRPAAHVPSARCYLGVGPGRSPSPLHPRQG